ncbi:membrane-associated protein [Pedobacter sp. UYP30]|uniref:DedA family protein n=1 Tax=Pedobacter sp. UYP30 TaxID=1756400 RepID=UPI003391864B
MDQLLIIHFQDFFNPEFYIAHGGLWLVLFIIFAETGLFVGFFLPGDSLIFISGIYSHSLLKDISIFSSNHILLNLIFFIFLLTIAGTLGNLASYWFGLKSGKLLYKKKDTFFFKKKHLFKAQQFYEKHGKAAILIARFLPIVRTFTPIVAGIVKMEKKNFFIFSFLGMIAWASVMLFAGHYLYLFFLNHYSFDIKNHLGVIVIVFVLVTTSPVIYKVIKR